MAKGKRRRCSKGKPCGATCIPRSKICRIEAADNISKYLTFLSRKAKNLPKRFKIKNKPSPALTPLSTSKEFLEKINNTDGFFSPLIKQLHLQIGKILGGGRWFKKNGEDVYGSKEEEERFRKVRSGLERRMGVEKLKDGITALVSYTKEDHKAMRDAQRGIFEKKNAGRKAELSKLSADLERLLAQPEFPKPEVEKFRGFKASPDQLRGMIENANGKVALPASALASWSTSLGQARKFSNLFIDDPSKTERVILRTINKLGVPIESVTGSPKEYEVLTPSSVNHRYVAYRQINSGGVTYHVFDLEESPKMG